jgi:hypothetical protein
MPPSGGGQLAPARNLGGRPKGAKNKRSTDLARYVAAQYDGMTPGQQAAAVCMVTGREIREAPDAAKALRIVDLGLAPAVLALVVKAKRLALALHCETKEAWLLMTKEREGLMPYVHQRQPIASDTAGASRSVAFVIPEGDAGPAPALTLFDDDDIGNIEEISADRGEVTRPKSPETDKLL